MSLLAFGTVKNVAFAPQFWSFCVDGLILSRKLGANSYCLAMRNSKAGFGILAAVPAKAGPFGGHDLPLALVPLTGTLKQGERQPPRASLFAHALYLQAIAEKPKRRHIGG